MCVVTDSSLVLSSVELVGGMRRRGLMKIPYHNVLLLLFKGVDRFSKSGGSSGRRFVDD